MKKMSLIFMAMACMACVKMNDNGSSETYPEQEPGVLSVRMMYEMCATRAVTDYVTVLDVEKAEKKVDVLVFDGNTGRLAASRSIGSVTDGCTFTLPVGKKTIYAVVNGPDLSAVSTVGQLKQLLYDLKLASLDRNGLLMMGSTDCNVTAGKAAVSETVTVRRLVSRVVLRNITCNVPSQYGKMHVDCAFLGNAYSRQTLSGEITQLCNVDGLAGDGAAPIGRNGEKGDCPDYFYRSVDKDVAIGAANTDKYHMYCLPDPDGEHTCLYILATIGDMKYYYRVPLYLGLDANATCTVDVEITNLGAELPPADDMQNGEIQAFVQIAGWDAGEEYTVKF